jgi:hypothetical protein
MLSTILFFNRNDIKEENLIIIKKRRVTIRRKARNKEVIEKE